MEWRFKGARDYLQGADLHDQICLALQRRGLTGLRKVDLTMHQMAREELTGWLLEKGEPFTDPVTAVFRFEEGGRARVVYLSPAGAPISRREPYPEEEIVQRCVLDLEGRVVTLEPTTLGARFSTLELLVSMTKLLHQRLYAETPGKWIFTNLKTPAVLPLSPAARLQVRFENAFGLALTRSALLLEGAPSGHIFFSLFQ
jgi:hypothetical protein